MTLALLAACQPADVSREAAATAPSVDAARTLGRSADPVGTPVAAPALVRVAIDGQPALGSESAPVVIVEFMDYECPFCRKFARTTFVDLRQRYIDAGKVRWVARNLPLPTHPRARPAAIAARCAAAQGRFWEMHDVLLTDSGSMADDELRAHARRFGLDEPAFSACLRSDEHGVALDADLEVARAARVRATPSFLVGRAVGDVVQGQMLVGDVGVQAFDAAIARYSQ
jgi:protein-disulfide isomerase